MTKHRPSEPVRRYLDAMRASQRAADARAALPLGSSRAKVTTANARWSRAAEERARLWAALTVEQRDQVDALLRGAS